MGGSPVRRRGQRVFLLAAIMKRWVQPDKEELDKIQQFVDGVLWGKLQSEDGLHPYCVRKSLFYSCSQHQGDVSCIRPRTQEVRQLSSGIPPAVETRCLCGSTAKSNNLGRI